MSFAPDPQPFAKPETILRVPVGLTSPLWGLFAGVAVTGATWWWMTHWMRPQNLEAMFGAAAESDTSAASQTETAQAITLVVEVPVVDQPEAALDPEAETLAKASPDLAYEAVVEPTIDLAPAPVVETLVAEADLADEVTAEAPQAFGENDPVGDETHAFDPAEPSFLVEATPGVAELGSEPLVDLTPSDPVRPGAPAKAKKKATAPKLDL